MFLKILMILGEKFLNSFLIYFLSCAREKEYVKVLDTALKQLINVGHKL